MAINTVSGNTLLTSGSFPPARAATTASVTLSGLQTIDGIALIAGDRVLVKNQTDQTTNGIYAANTGPWVRTSDASQNTQFFSGMAVTAALGAINGGQTFLCTTTDDPVVIGTSNITFISQSLLIGGNVSINAGTTNQLAYYAANGTSLSGLATANSGVLITSAGGVPSISSTLPQAVQANITKTGTVASGTWNGNLIGATYGGTGINNGSNTITLSGNLAFSGAFNTTFTVTGNTTLTLPTSDTLVGRQTTDTLSNKTLNNPILTGNTTLDGVGDLASANITATNALNYGLILIGQAPITLTGTSGSTSSVSQIINSSNNFTLTLPNAVTLSGRWLYVKQIAAFTVVSASSNVVPIGSATPGTAILSGQGKFADLQSDGANWIIMRAN